MEDPEFTDFWQLLSYHDAITPEIQRVALAAEVFWPCEIYYHAPADVRDGLIHALLSAEYSSAASNLMSCLLCKEMTRQWRLCWSWSEIPGPGARASM